MGVFYQNVTMIIGDYDKYMKDFQTLMENLRIIQCLE